jgi:glycosyltransferase involved in cell wall biosynthesis
VILLSKLLYYDIEKYVPEEKVYYCPNGIKELNFKKDDKDPERKIVNILFFSNLIKSKGVLMLVEACNILRLRKIDYSCTIAGGEGDLTINEIQEEILASNLNQIISISGMIQGKDKIDIFRKADIFVFPTFYHNECMPLVLLEAMQYSLPIVTTSEGAIPDLVEDGITGFIIPSRNVEALAEKLGHLIQNPVKRESMGQKGFKKYQKDFTIDLFETRIADILDDVFRKSAVYAQ